MNVRGAYHVANTTDYVTTTGETDSEAIDVLPVDWELYETFWSLQKYLARPNEVETLDVRFIGTIFPLVASS